MVEVRRAGVWVIVTLFGVGPVALAGMVSAGAVSPSVPSGAAPVAQTASTGAARSATPRSTRDGVFTAAQAERGELAFRACTYCHGRDLRGGDDPPGPALKGEIFMQKWSQRPLGELFDRIAETMPRDRPGTLEPQAYADILAYVLSANRLPAGASELPPVSDTLRDILVAPVPLESR